MWNMGTIFPEPLSIMLTVPGPDVVVWDAIVLMPESAVGTSVPDSPPAIASVRLYQNEPNPAFAGTTIRYELPHAAPARLSVFDLSGRLVRTLFDESRPSGPGSAFWDARAHDGARVASGVYVYRLTTPGRTESRTLVMLR
jgi:hypothetical protein